MIPTRQVDHIRDQLDEGTDFPSLSLLCLLTNSAPSDSGRARLINMQAVHMAELRVFEQGVARDIASIETCGAAISNIEEGILHAKEVVKVSQSNLAAVRESQERVAKLGSRTATATASDAHSYMDILNRIDTTIGTGTSSELKRLEDQEHELQTRIDHLLSMLSSLERELQDWKVESGITIQSLRFHTRSQEEASSILQVIARLLSSIKRVPADVWREIFLLDMTWSRNQPLTSHGSGLPHAVSQVCREWRLVALGTPELWNRIEIAPVSWWPNLEHKRVKELVRRSSGTSIELVYQLQRSRDWETQAMASQKIGALYLHSEHIITVRSTRRVYPSGTRKSASWEEYDKTDKKPTYQEGYTGAERQDLVSISADLISQPYSIHFYGAVDGWSVGERTMTIPFKHPKSVTIEEPNAHSASTLKQILAPFDQLEKLILVNLSPTTPNDFTKLLSSLKYLRLEGHATFPFEITPNLEELHIRHSRVISWDAPTERVSLPKLHTLSITLQECQILPLIDAPLLKTLLLDAAASAGNPSPVLETVITGITNRPIKNICLRGWLGEAQNLGLQEVARRVFPSCRGLSELTLDHCHSDSSMSLWMQNIPGLKVVTLAHCSGLTQADCESLKLHVEKLNVYM